LNLLPRLTRMKLFTTKFAKSARRAHSVEHLAHGHTYGPKLTA
jgi:hypothetical protein